MIVVVGFTATGAGQLPARPSNRAPLGPREREALVALLDAVDGAQRNGADADARFPWDTHVLKSTGHKGYIPFTISLDAVAEQLKSGLLYVRAVSTRRGGTATVEQHSELRAWMRGAQPTPRMPEAVFVGAGEMPVGGPAVGSSRRSTQAAAEGFAALELQHRVFEREKAAEEERRKREESRDPSLFPFEEYYFFDAKSWQGPPGSRHRIGRAIALPPGEYDLYLAFVDRAHVKDAAPVVFERRVVVPDFWNDELRLSSLMLTSELQMLNAPLARKDQGERPYTFGLADAAPSLSLSFSAADVLTIVYQMCNYGAPDSEVTAEYRFFRVDTADGSRRLFNSTLPQVLKDEDLPPSSPWETQAFVMQRVPLTSFPAGRYELEVTLRDRTTRAATKAAAMFSVKN